MLPFVVVKYGGSIFGGTVVHIALTIFAQGRPATHLTVAAALIPAAVEFSVGITLPGWMRSG